MRMSRHLLGVVVVVVVTISVSMAQPTCGGQQLYLAGCPFFTPQQPYFMSVSDWPVAPGSDIAIALMNASVDGNGPTPGASSYVSEGSRAGMPVNFVSSTNVSNQLVSFDCTYSPLCDNTYNYYPIPGDYVLEGAPNPFGAWDRHLLIVDKETCYLHEIFYFQNFLGIYVAVSGISWNLTSTNQSFNSRYGAEAAGLPMVPGIYTFDEITAGCVPHALRMAFPMVNKSHIWPATRTDGRSNDSRSLPMGARLRLKKTFDLGRLDAGARVLATAMKTFGIMVADTNGPGAWTLSGEYDLRWNDTDLATLRQIKPTDLEWVLPPF